jgi:ligand-binding sensor domain-containing protein/signal transduction histidine kinase
MLKNCGARMIACLAACAWASVSSTFSRASSAGDFPYFVHRVPEEWLPQSSVFGVTQTHDGYLWLGTLNGLVRFDGMHCTVFTEANMPGLRSSQIVFLSEDSQSNLWIGTETAGLVLINRDGLVRTLDFGSGSPGGRLVSACEDAAGTMWLNTLDGQVARCQSNNVEILNGRARPVIAEKFGPLWFGMGRGLVTMRTLSNSSAFFWEQEYPVSKLDFLLAGKTNGCWRLADGRVQKWVNGHLERDWGAYPWGDAQVNAACEDNRGNLVVGTQDRGAFWYDAQGNSTQISAKNGLSHDTVLSLCVDRDGDLWVGTDGRGLNLVRPKLFDIQEDSLGRTIQSVCEDREGGLWFANFGGKLSHWNGGASRQYDVKQDGQNPYVRSVFVDRDHVVWVGTTLEGLFVQHGDSFQHVAASEALGPVSVIFQDRAGRLWFGTRDGLLCRNGETWKALTTGDGLSANDVRALAEDAEGNLWIGTEGGGLDYLRAGQVTVSRENVVLPSQSITSLFMDREGILWIGTRAGLARLQSRGHTDLLGKKLLLGTAIAYLIDDDQGYLWIGSNVGLIRARKRALNDWAGDVTNSLPYRLYGTEDGLPTRECTQGSQPAAGRTPDGRLWFSTIQGLVSANPRELTPNPNPPPVVIESVLVDGQEQNSNNLCSGWLRAVTVPAGKELLEIRYTSLNLASRDRALFRYRLEGYETAWTEAGNRTVAPFSKLSPGHYRFHVIACNEDGKWNETGASLAVTVLPPFWRTWWFVALNTLVLLTVLTLVVHYVSTQKLHRQLAVLKQQEALDKERARIARDLHDQLGANLTQVAILGEMAVGDKHLPHEVETHAQQISQTARETTLALDEIVWAVNPSYDTLEGLISYACKYAQDYFAVAGLRHRLDVPTQLPHLSIAPELRHNVFLAFKEAVNNVVKHAQASEAWIRLVSRDGSFAIEIQDNGRGPGNIQEKQGRNGLRNMRKRMEDVGGSFSIGPAPEGGTLVRLTVPVGKR